jgi:pyridoxal phosphate enzyme (YggS family)
MAVTKGHAPEAVAEAVRAGLKFFGENKVQEAKAKIPLCPSQARWCFIGHLQSNKCRDAVHLFEAIHSVDSFKLAEELNRRAEEAGKRVPIMLEVNIGGEASKFGYQPEAALADLPEIQKLRRLELQGFMAIPPWSPDPEKVRPLFRKVADLRRRAEEQAGIALPELSMGMSGDFEVAIEEGATIVRLGTGLFGARPKFTARRQAGTDFDG